MKQKFLYRYRVLVFLSFLTFICQLDRVAFSVLGVRIMAAFHLNKEQFGWAVSAFAFAYALFEIPSGIWGDRIGQRSLFIRIVLCWSLFTALTGVTVGLGSLIVVRFLFGIGEAGAWPNGTAALSRWMPAKETSRGTSSMQIGGALGNALAPIIIVPIAVVFGWRMPFFVITLFGVLWVLVCVFWFKNNPSEQKNISQKEKDYIEQNRRIENHQHRLSWRVVFKNRNLLFLPLCYFCGMVGWTFYVYWLPVYVQDGLHFSENEAKSITSVIYVAGAISAFIIGIVSDWLVKKRGLKFGRRFIGITCLSIGAMMFFSTVITTNNAVVVTCLFIAFFVIVSNAMTSWSTCIDIGGNHVGTVSGMMNTGGQTGGILIGIVVGKLVNISHGYTSSLFAVGAVLMGGALLWLLIDPTKKLVVEDKRPVRDLEIMPSA
jgi:MFS transporter, ACS family, glucarate transporter